MNHFCSLTSILLPLFFSLEPALGAPSLICSAAICVEPVLRLTPVLISFLQSQPPTLFGARLVFPPLLMPRLICHCSVIRCLTATPDFSVRTRFKSIPFPRLELRAFLDLLVSTGLFSLQTRTAASHTSPRYLLTLVVLAAFAFPRSYPLSHTRYCAHSI